MDGTMAPPPKRRKLSRSVSEQYFRLDNSTVPAHVVQSYSSGVDSSQNTHSSLAPARTGFPQDDRIQQAEVGGIADFRVLVPRQGTGSSSSSLVSTDSEIAISIPSVSIPSVTASISISLSVTAPSPTLPADTIPAGVTPSESSSSPSPSSSVSGSVSSSSVNETSTITSSASRSISTTASSRPQNLTTSAIILEGASSTTTLKTTINLDNVTSSTSVTNSAFFFWATLPNGDITSLSRHDDDAYTTTLDGRIFTVPSISATTTRERTSASSRTSTASRTSSTSSTNSEQSTVTSTMEVTNIAGQGEATATYSSTTSSTSAASGGGGGGGSTPPAGTIAGGVVGGAAGLAVLVLIAMLFLRWYRRKSQVGHQALPAGSTSSPESPEQPIERSGPGMAERAGLMPFAAAIPGLFRHQNRSAEDPAPSERGFTRVSGRKLPSAFSGGMSSEGARSLPSQPPPGMPLSGSPPDERNLSSTSFYRDSAGFYGGHGANGRSSTSPTSLHSPTSPSSSAPIHSGPEIMTMSSGPQRQPQVHAPGPYMSPATSEHPHSPPGASAQFARSDTPASLRNSRFTEDM